MSKKKYTFIDLFAGIGGIRLALERAGGTCVFSSEWDESCQDTYEANFGDRPVGDIMKVDADDIPDHDILAAGFPCQAFSIIGERLGFADTRGTLFFEIERILRAKRPKAFLLENVRQLTSHDKGRTLKVILDHLEKLDYFVHYKVLNGLDFGVPQKRERVVLVGFDQNRPFQFPNGNSGITKRSLAEILEPDEKVSEKFFISDHIKNKLKKRVKTIPKEPTVWHENKSGNIGIHPFSCALRANASYNYLLVNGRRRLTPREMLRLQGFPDSFKIVVNDTQVRKQAGNSVVVPKIEAVAKELVKALNSKPVSEMYQAEIFATVQAQRIYAH
ncbi:MAG: DNA cytosine methyltransferase [Candidatus Zixiibacteriota bacterium]